MPLSPVDKCLANLGINPRPVREKYETMLDPVMTGFKMTTDFVYDWTTRCQGKEPVEARIRDAFYRFDGDGNGHVDSDELKLALGALGFNVDINSAEQILNHYDDDGNETLELEEFAIMVIAFEKISKVRVEEAQIEEAHHLSAHLETLKEKRMSRASKAEEAGEPLEVRRLSQFLDEGITGLTPRDEDSLEVSGGEERDQGTAATIEFLRSLGVTLKQK